MRDGGQDGSKGIREESLGVGWILWVELMGFPVS